MPGDGDTRTARLRASLIRDTVTNMTNTPRHAVAAEVRAAIAKAGTTPTHVAKAIGLTRQAFSRRTRGLTPFGIDELVAVAGSLGIEPASLLPKLDEVSPPDQIHQVAS